MSPPVAVAKRRAAALKGRRTRKRMAAARRKHEAFERKRMAAQCYLEMLRINGILSSSYVQSED